MNDLQFLIPQTDPVVAEQSSAFVSYPVTSNPNLGPRQVECDGIGQVTHGAGDIIGALCGGVAIGLIIAGWIVLFIAWRRTKRAADLGRLGLGDESEEESSESRSIRLHSESLESTDEDGSRHSLLVDEMRDEEGNQGPLERRNEEIV
ncbi:hypothetical protein BDZ89DRAFT_1071700 [Hymenopellis radicata]|nr:hypothetical protein BDZ89DRAFT_1071700 [Hymenopellis radicata]